MSDWIENLNGRHDGEDRVTFDHPDPARQALDASVVTPLAHLGVLDVHGADAERFLQGQASAQLSLADGYYAPLTGFCTPKGRMLANAQLLRIAEGHYRLLLHHGLVAPLAKHLDKFAAFYKAELEPRHDLALIGLIGVEARALAEVHFDVVPPSLWHQAGNEQLQVVTHPGPRPRILACLPEERAIESIRQLTPHATLVGNAAWCLHDIQSGLYWLTPHHQDALLPQMINWEALGGISFKKGCYTGQEVVARAHFRGQVKKRLYRAQLEGDRLPEPGAAVRDANDKAQGEVLAAELDAYGQAEILAVLSTKEEIGPLSVDGQALKLLKLPYPVERLDPETLAEQL
ncbi:CAF17-like 4Fe-4S cluster assembly/insertion protein YgfZ [Halomonas faecis]|uniref:CAF17-like 4Fe-4S cluster assembly/insertion protein YgfZ n=1 Tax=Halomonas faecis TaxID=1562110 RepID=UPI0013D3B295|nr:folate-binding protein YgfZ [Halomonas faecis]